MRLRHGRKEDGPAAVSAALGTGAEPDAAVGDGRVDIGTVMGPPAETPSEKEGHAGTVQASSCEPLPDGGFGSEALVTPKAYAGRKGHADPPVLEAMEGKGSRAYDERLYAALSAVYRDVRQTEEDVVGHGERRGEGRMSLIRPYDDAPEWAKGLWSRRG